VLAASTVLAPFTVPRRPVRPARAGHDVPAGRDGLAVHPAHVRYAVHRPAPPAARDRRRSGTVVAVAGTYRFWWDGAGSTRLRRACSVGARVAASR
jgi:hypothetical protein